MARTPCLRRCARHGTTWGLPTSGVQVSRWWVPPTYLVSKLNARKLKKQLDATLKSTNADDALVKTLNRQLRWNISRNIDSALHAAKYGAYKTGQGLAHATGFKGLEKLFGYSAPKGRGLIKSLFNLARGKVF